MGGCVVFKLQCFSHICYSLILQILREPSFQEETLFSVIFPPDSHTVKVFNISTYFINL